VPRLLEFLWFNCSISSKRRVYFTKFLIMSYLLVKDYLTYFSFKYFCFSSSTRARDYVLQLDTTMDKIIVARIHPVNSYLKNTCIWCANIFGTEQVFDKYILFISKWNSSRSSKVNIFNTMILSKLDPIPTFTTYLSKIHLNVIMLLPYHTPNMFPRQYLVKCTSYEAPHYAVFFRLPPYPPS
jgi:hypothetical protein